MMSPRRTLYRTLSDESVCRNRKCTSFAASRCSVLDQVLPSDILFSTTPPYHSTLPPRAFLGPGGSNLSNQRVASFCTMTDTQRAEALQISEELTRQMAAMEGVALEAGESTPATLTGKVNQLELILRQLQFDLRKEKEDKAMLQVEVQNLREDNMRLQEESQTAAAQLRRFTEWFFHTIDKKP